MDAMQRWAGAVALAAIVFGSYAARAEGFVDLYLGGAFTQSDRLRFSGAPPGVATGLTGRTEFDDSAVGGIRGGYWLDELPWVGVALDISGFSPEKQLPGNNADIGVIPIAALLMVRAPLGASDRVPGGHVMPYAAVGPAGFISVISLRLPGEDFADATADVGVDVHAGLKIRFVRWFGVFAEYRYTSFEAKWNDELSGFDTDIKTDIETHHINFGVGFHF